MFVRVSLNNNRLLFWLGKERISASTARNIHIKIAKLPHHVHDYKTLCKIIKLAPLLVHTCSKMRSKAGKKSHYKLKRLIILEESTGKSEISCCRYVRERAIISLVKWCIWICGFSECHLLQFCCNCTCSPFVFLTPFACLYNSNSGMSKPCALLFLLQALFCYSSWFFITSVFVSD